MNKFKLIIRILQFYLVSVDNASFSIDDFLNTKIWL